MDPLVFTPYLRPMVWGDRRLGTRLHKSLPDEQTYGESWEVSGHRSAVSVVSEGPLAGHSLSDLCTRLAGEFYGPEGGPSAFPLLVKFLDAHDWLSVQVHPDDRLAHELAPGEGGKTEAWVILHAEPGSRIWAGLYPGVGPDDVRRHLETGTVAECLYNFVPKPGDCVFLPAGTVHAVGGGVLMAEVQQTSDATFRLFDWNRIQPDGTRRKLHLRESLASIDWNAGPVHPVQGVAHSALPNGVRGERLVACPFFTLDRLVLEGPLERPSPGYVEIVLFLQGQVRLRSPGGYDRQFKPGETVVIPATAGVLNWQPVTESATVLLVRIRHTENGERGA